MTARELGRDAVMINCNPETVSTDYDTSDRLYFEPLTAEDVLAVCEQERPEGVIVQFGGQTPLKLARELEEAGVPLLGTPVDAIDLAEDRGRFGALLRRLGIKHPPYGTALSAEEAAVIAEEVGFPLLVRPSYVLGGRAMEICYSTEDLSAYLEAHVKADQEHPLLLDRFLENAIEVDVDALSDGETVNVAGIMQHVEEAGVHSGDSACVIPPMSLGEEMLEEIRATTERIALELGVIGLINIQYGVAGGELYVIEANPRASRTVPFVSKAIGAPLAKIACRLMLGESLADQDLPTALPTHVSVKEAVLPFARFAGADSVLGPEMKSTGEVMGIAADFPTAFGKAQSAAGVTLPSEGAVFITVTDTDKPAATQIAARFHDLGFEVIATGGTAQAISRHGRPGDPDQQARRGLPARRRPDPRAPLRPRDQHPDRVRRPRRRLRDPHRRSPPRRPLRDDDDRRDRGCPGDRRPRQPARPRSAVLQEIHGDDQDRPASMTRTASAAASARSTENRASGGYRVFSLLDEEGPAPEAGQFYMLAAERHWEERGGRPYLPRAISVADAQKSPHTGDNVDGVQFDFLVEGIGPGTERLCELEAGERVWVNGPLGNAFSEPRELAPGAAGAILVGGGIGVAPLALLRRRFAARGVPTQILLGFRDRAHCGGLDDLFSSCQIGLASEDGHLGAPRLRHRPAGGDARGRRRGGAPSSTPAARRRCWRPCGRCAPTGASPASWRWSRRWPAASAPASAAPCRSPTGGYMRLCVDGPVVRRRPGRRGDPCLSSAASPLRAPRDQRLRDLRRDRRPARLRGRAARGVPVLRLRLEDDHPGAARRQRAPADLGDPGRDDQLDRPAEQGPGGVPRARTCRSWPSCRCR